MQPQMRDRKIVHPKVPPPRRTAGNPFRIFAEQAFSRAVGAPLVAGNSLRLLRDARENYPAWLSAIESAEHTIHFESYIIHEDAQGQIFAEALAEKARAGVRVRVIYDWMGGLFPTSNKFWRSLQAAGVEVRCFNPPRLDSPFGWLGRDHRKMLAIDGRIGFVAGLCVGQMWVGDAVKGIEPWRDTGVEVRGPAVADIEQSFALMWAETGEPLPEDEIVQASAILPEGNVHLRVVASIPNTAALYRLDQMVAATARETLWLTDAYFAGTSPYVQALRSASLDGVDVRLLVPQATDLPVMRALSRSGYRTLLEAGVRVFEWNGPMIHAKTAVADGRWARVGSSNLNLASWITNWELDVVVEDEAFGEEMEQMYFQDLQNATEIVLTAKRKVFTPHKPRVRRLREKFGLTSSGRTAAGAVRLGNAVSAAIANRRILSPAEARIMFSAGVLLVLFSVVAVLWPRWVSVPLGVMAAWVAVSLFIRAFKLHTEGKLEEQALREALEQPQPPPDEESLTRQDAE